MTGVPVTAETSWIARSRFFQKARNTDATRLSELRQHSLSEEKETSRSIRNVTLDRGGLLPPACAGTCPQRGYTIAEFLSAREDVVPWRQSVACAVPQWPKFSSSYFCPPRTLVLCTVLLLLRVSLGRKAQVIQRDSIKGNGNRIIAATYRYKRSPGNLLAQTIIARPIYPRIT